MIGIDAAKRVSERVERVTARDEPGKNPPGVDQVRVPAVQRIANVASSPRCRMSDEVIGNGNKEG